MYQLWLLQFQPQPCLKDHFSVSGGWLFNKNLYVPIPEVTVPNLIIFDLTVREPEDVPRFSTLIETVPAEGSWIAFTIPVWDAL